jgi:chemotaxis protein CheD
MTRSSSDLPRFHLLPGQIQVVRSPAILQTILGSCVGITFWSKRLGSGALCHGVLPICPRDWPAGSSVSGRTHYVDFSIRQLAREFDEMGARREELEVKLFGGADVLAVSDENRKLTVGALNCQAAADVLAAEGFKVLASDLRGTSGRKIQFHTGTGEVLVQKLNFHEQT